MNRRLYFLLPDQATSEQTFDQLLLARVSTHQMHFLSHDGADLGRLPAANLLQKTDVVHGLWVGLVAGGLAGITTGLLIHFYSSLSVLGLGVILFTAIAGALFGCWVSTMVGISCPNSRLVAFKGMIDKGRILLMLDVPKRRVQEIAELVKRTQPRAESGGMETIVPAFP